MVCGQVATEAVSAAGLLVERGSGGPEELEPTEARGRSVVGGTGGGGDERCERQAAVGAEVAWRDAGGGGEQRKGDGGTELLRRQERDVGHGHGEGAEGHGGGDGEEREGDCTRSQCGREERKGKETEEEDARDGEAAENVTECDFR